MCLPIAERSPLESFVAAAEAIGTIKLVLLKTRLSQSRVFALTNRLIALDRERYRQQPKRSIVRGKGFTSQQDTIPSNIIPKPSIFALNAFKLEE
jgi:hypothetical protein